MPPSLVFLAVAVVTSLAATVATSTGNTNLFRWLDCPSPPSSLSSIFHSNVLTLLDALPSAAAPTGFASLSRGEEGTDDRAFVRGLCRGDSASDDCARCLRSAVLGINRRCSSSSNRRRAAIWYDKCFLSHADTNASTTYEEGFRQELYSHGHRRKVSHRDRAAFDFEERYLNLVVRISDLAANGGSSLAVPMFATGEAATTVYGRGGRRRNGTMYGMAQCTRDRTAAECALCLWKSMEQQAAATGVMLGYNCYLRVQMYPFYDLALDALPAPPPAPVSNNLHAYHRRKK